MAFLLSEKGGNNMGLEIDSNIITTKTKKSDIVKIDFAACAEPTQTLDKYYANLYTKPDILINGGLFSFATGKSVMDFIDEHRIKSQEDWVEYGFGIDVNGNLQYGKDSDKVWKDFISAYPPLVVNGIKQPITFAKEIAGRARRTVLGYDDDYIYTITIDNPGVTLEKAATIALETGCKYAINLDGGGSTRLLYQGVAFATASYNRPVDNVIAIYIKKEPIILYRVQVGAFSSKQSAMNFCSTIKQLGSNYENAFVTFIEPYYKVQVGAFKVKENAENLLKDLKNKGYNGFIVTTTIS